MLASLPIPTARVPILVESPKTAQHEMERLIEKLLRPVYDEMRSEIEASHAKLDAPEEYQRIRGQCTDW